MNDYKNTNALLQRKNEQLPEIIRDIRNLTDKTQDDGTDWKYR